MALPVLNDQPKYDVTIPSNGSVVRYRPYLVKEEKVLMMALESKDTQKALSAIVDTIESCVQDQIDTNVLTTFDVEYLFTQIRSKSVGETTKLNLPCSECGTPNEVEVNIASITLDVPKVNKIVKITEDISLTMKYPFYKEIINADIDQTKASDSFKLIAKCLHSVQTKDENILVKDESESDIQSFLESLTSDQFIKIQKFIESMPKMEHKIEFTCIKCGHKNERTLSGINDFFQSASPMTH